MKLESNPVTSLGSAAQGRSMPGVSQNRTSLAENVEPVKISVSAPLARLLTMPAAKRTAATVWALRCMAGYSAASGNAVRYWMRLSANDDLIDATPATRVSLCMRKSW